MHFEVTIPRKRWKRRNNSQDKESWLVWNKGNKINYFYQENRELVPKQLSQKKSILGRLEAQEGREGRRVVLCLSISRWGCMEFKQERGLDFVYEKCQAQEESGLNFQGHLVYFPIPQSTCNSCMWVHLKYLQAARRVWIWITNSSPPSQFNRFANEGPEGKTHFLVSK